MSKCGNIQGDWLCRTKCCSLRFVKAFRINEHTRHVPYAVRSVLRNDQKDKNKKERCVNTYIVSKKNPILPNFGNLVTYLCFEKNKGQ